MHGTSGKPSTTIDPAGQAALPGDGHVDGLPDDMGGADAISDAELKALMLQARVGPDDPLRRLIVSYLMLRRVTAEVITLVSAREGGASIANTPLLRRARELSTRESPR